MSFNEIQKSLELLKKDWDIDPIIHDFVLGKIKTVSDFTLKIGAVVFHIPFLPEVGKYILWKCYWPDCHNCCNRQGRLPLTSDDLIQIGIGLKYKKTSEFYNISYLQVYRLLYLSLFYAYSNGMHFFPFLNMYFI